MERIGGIKPDDGDSPATGHGAAWQQRHDGNAQTRFDHAHNRLGARGFERHAWRRPTLVERIEDVLPAGRTAFVQDQ